MNLGFTVSSFFSSGLTIYFGIKRNDYWYLGSMIDYCLFYGIIFLIPLIFIPSNYLNPSKKNKKNKENENEEELIDVVCDN
jgi:phosphotransferase system  glucose/maltose/N-acetylglucosamine-specific IIC component